MVGVKGLKWKDFTQRFTQKHNNQATLKNQSGALG